MAPTTETSRSQQISRVPYLPGLDGLRALAVIAVIIYHANSAWLPGGFLGVEVFFVISGYLITLLLVAEEERTGTVSLRDFWLRRARRLLPALFTMMVLLIMWTSVRERDALGSLRGDVIAGTLYGSNWFQAWQGAGYTAANDFAPLRHLWSLGVEEQFYLVWPVIMLIILRQGRDSLPRVATWFVGIAFVIAGLVAILMPSGRIGDSCTSTPSAFWNIGDRCLSKIDLLYLSTPTRATGLLLGAALAIVWRPYALLRGPMKRKGKLMDPIAVLGLILLVFLVSKVHIVHLVGEDGLHADPWLFRGGLLLTGVATLMIIAAVAHQKALTGRILGNVVLRVIGERSYGLYLYHWPIFQAIRHETGIALKPHEFVVGILITVLVAEGSYRLIELPIRERRLRESLRSLLRGGPQAMQRRSSFAAITACSLLLPIFAVVSLATADERPNEVQASLDAGDDAVTDVLDELTPDISLSPSTSLAVEVPVSTTSFVPPYYQVFALGDSVMKGAAPALADLGIVVDAVQDRQGKMGADIFNQLQDLRVTMDAVVIHLGTNGPMSQKTLDSMMDAVAGVPRVVVLTGKANRSWTDENNKRIRALPSAYPNVVVLDWELVATLCEGRCLTADGIHLDRDGMKYYAAEIWKALGREILSN
jgi:peptidoglycan/LPS O-acetylase OafA/YrhL